MRAHHLLPVLACTAAVAGCGSKAKEEPATPARAAAKPAADKREPIDVRLHLAGSGAGSSIFVPPAKAGVQRITLRNDTAFPAVLTGSSKGGASSVDVPAGATRSTSWPRRPGADRVRTKVKVPGHPNYTRSTVSPVD